MAQFIYKHRRGTTAQWQAATSLIPYDGEIIIEERADGTSEIKVGDGIHTFHDLPYFHQPLIAKTQDEFEKYLVAANVGQPLSYADNLYLVIQTNDGISAKLVGQTSPGGGDAENSGWIEDIRIEGTNFVTTFTDGTEKVAEIDYTDVLVATTDGDVSDKIEYIDLAGDSREISDIDEGGISIDIDDINIQYQGENEFSFANGRLLLPIVPGDNITFTNKGDVVEIDATGGSSSSVSDIAVIEVDQHRNVSVNDIGITWEDDINLLDEDDGQLTQVYRYNKVPVVEGDGVRFDIENGVVKINSTNTKIEDIAMIDTWANGNAMDIVVEAGTGISWDEDFSMYKDIGAREEVLNGRIYHNIPIEAGEGIEFEQGGTTVKINATGSGIADVQVNGTSVVADGVANIPAASATQAGVVITGGQTFGGAKTIKSENTNSGQKVLLYLNPNTPVSNRAYSAMRFETITKDGASYPYIVGLSALNAFDIKANFSYSGNDYNFVNYAGTKFTINLNNGAYSGGKVNCGSLTEQLYLRSQNNYSAVPTYTGTLMSAPETWSTGTSGTATLPSAGLYEIKTLLQHPNPEATYGFVIHSVIYWDGTNATNSELIRTFAVSASTCHEFYISETGIITFGEIDFDGFGGGTISTQISYRKIGIA